MPQVAPSVPGLDDMTLPEKVVEYVGYTGAVIEKAAAQENRLKAQRAKVAALIPAAVNALVANGRIREDQCTKAAEALADPVQALELLTKVAAHRTADELAQLGTGVPTTGTTKTASANDPARSLTNPNVGARSTMVKQSDVNFFRKLGLPAPTE